MARLIEWIIVQDTGFYWVNVDVNGCFSVDSVYVGKCERYEDPCLEIPNAFSNNGDGVNDFFKPLNFCPLDNYSFTVFNRWGQVVFETSNPDEGWNGFYKGKRAQQGVYAYVIQYDYSFKGTSFSNVEKGTVIMLR